jgi:hypothetical protein
MDEEKKKGGFQKGFDPRRSVGGRKTRDEYGAAVIDQAREHGAEMLAILVDIARNSPKDADRVKAADKVLTRAYGAAKQTIDITSTSSHTEVVHRSVNIDQIGDDVKRALLDAMLNQEAIEGHLIEDRGGE